MHYPLEMVGSVRIKSGTSAEFYLKKTPDADTRERVTLFIQIYFEFSVKNM